VTPEDAILTLLAERAEGADTQKRRGPYRIARR
jgi:hypothetical protein